MKTIPKKVDPIVQAHRKALFWTYFAVVAAFLCMGLINLYAYFTIQKMSKINSTLTNAALNIKLDVTSANLLFREIISEVSSKDMNEVWKIIDNADKYANVLKSIDNVGE